MKQEILGIRGQLAVLQDEQSSLQIDAQFLKGVVRSSLPALEKDATKLSVDEGKAAMDKLHKVVTRLHELDKAIMEHKELLGILNGGI